MIESSETMDLHFRILIINTHAANQTRQTINFYFLYNIRRNIV